MAIHAVQVQCDGITYDPWFINEDTTNIFILYQAIQDDLESTPDYRFDVRAHIRGGEHVIIVDSDKQLMEMFRLNSDPAQTIMLDVKKIEFSPLSIMDPASGSKGATSLDEVGSRENEDATFEDEVGEPEVEVEDSEGLDESLNEAADSNESDDDPEWKYGRGYSEEDESSESIGDIVISSDDEVWIEDDTPVDPRQRKFRDEGHCDPNSNIPDAPSPIADDEKIHLQLWQSFDDHKHFSDVLMDYCIQEGFELKRKKNDRRRVTAVCKAEGCPWRIHASTSPDGTCFLIKTFSEEHTCQQVRKNSCAKPSWVAAKLVGLLKHDLDMSVHALRGALQEKYAIEVDKTTIWKARAKAKEHIYGNHAKSFSKLRCYAHMVLETNFGSIAIVNSEVVLPTNGNLENTVANAPPPIFKRLFICYDVVRKGFLNGCRPFIGLDGCHLKGPFKGILLAAVGVDANLQFYPVAYGIVESENIETWIWFVDQLKEALGEYNKGMPWTIMSDRQKGIVDAVPNMPRSVHRFCAWHIWQNFHKKFPGPQFKKLFWKAANTANFNSFLQIMAEIRRINVQAYDYLINIDVKHWSRSKFEHESKVDLNTNNHTESFNGWLDNLRHNPPIQLLEGLREQHTQLMYTRHVISTRYRGDFPPKVKKILQVRTKKSRNCIVRRCGEYEFQVEYGDFKGSVRLNDKHCDCEIWQVSGIPCVHSLACINTVRANVLEYVDKFFSLDMWKNCYIGVIHPIPSMNMWPPFENYDLQPPVARPLPGRPKKRRRRSEGESQPQTRAQSSTKRCSRCNGFGHNRRSCGRQFVHVGEGGDGVGCGGGIGCRGGRGGESNGRTGRGGRSERVAGRGVGLGRRGGRGVQPNVSVLDEIATSHHDLFGTQETQAI